MKERNEKTRIDEIIKEESNVLWWIRRDLTTLTVETSDGMELSFTPDQKDKWEQSIHERVMSVAHCLKTQAALLPPDDRIMAVITYRKLNKFLWDTKESTSQYAQEKIEITDILTNIQKALLLVHNKTPIMDGYNTEGEDRDTVRDEAISALSRLVTEEDKDGYHQKIADVFLDVIENRDKERWSTVSSAILGLWPFLSETHILIELVFQPAVSNKITYDELADAEAAAVSLKNQAVFFVAHRSQLENIHKLLHQKYLKKMRLLEENLLKNENQLKGIELIYHCLDRCLEDIEQIKIQEERAKPKKIEEKRIETQHPVETFVDREALILMSLLREGKEGFVEFFLNDPRHLEMHLSYVRRCIGIINTARGEKSELKLWLIDHPLKKGEMLGFFRKMEDELHYRLKHKLSCLYVPKKVLVEEKTTIGKCPVCGMDVNVEKTEQQVKHEGVIYYFCCNFCKTVFEEEPARYHQILNRGK